ncbi:MAG: phytanoyl-CoA dioxygenase family protein [Pseudomonadota bacterium]
MSETYPESAAVLSDDQVQQFIRDGFVRLDGAFPRELADECLAYLWRDTGCDPDNPSTWTKPVIWIDGHGEEPFEKAINTPKLHGALDQIVGKGRWRPRSGIGSFPIRFPSSVDQGDTGWHVDKSFAAEESVQGDFNSWRANVTSKDRALLMLFLFSDVGPKDAPTRIRLGSHRDIARLLQPAGEAGLPSIKIDAAANALTHCPEVLASGEAGTVFLCHPFLVHAAQLNRGNAPRFLAQPCLYPKVPLQLSRDDNNYSPVETAIRQAIGKQGN